MLESVKMSLVKERQKKAQKRLLDFCYFLLTSRLLDIISLCLFWLGSLNRETFSVKESPRVRQEVSLAERIRVRTSTNSISDLAKSLNRQYSWVSRPTRPIFLLKSPKTASDAHINSPSSLIELTTKSKFSRKAFTETLAIRALTHSNFTRKSVPSIDNVRFTWSSRNSLSGERICRA
jgi:hypothetical protein